MADKKIASSIVDQYGGYLSRAAANQLHDNLVDMLVTVRAEGRINGIEEAAIACDSFVPPVEADRLLDLVSKKIRALKVGIGK